METWLTYLFVSYVVIISSKISIANYYDKEYNKIVHNTNKYMFLNLLLFLTLFASLRVVDLNQGGTDAYAYVSYFLYQTYDISLDSVLSTNLLNMREPLFVFITIIVRMVTDNYHVYLFVCHILITYCVLRYVFYFYDKHANFLSLLMVTAFCIYSFNILRGCMAVSVCLLSMIYIDQQCWKKALMYILVASLLHYTALGFVTVLLVSYCYDNKFINFDRKNIIILIILGNLFFYFSEFTISQLFIETKYSAYFLKETELSLVGRIPDFLFGLFLLLLYPYIQDSRTKKFAVLMFLYYGMAYFRIYLMGWRLDDYFIFIRMYLLSQAFRVNIFNECDFKHRFIYCSLVYMYIIFVFIKFMYSMYESSGIYPYTLDIL